MQNSSNWKYAEKWKAPFFTIWGGQAVSVLGSQLVSFALIWWLTEKTGSATVLSIAALVGLLPQVVLGPIVGTLVDRWNRRIVMIMADTLTALATAVLAGLFFADIVEIWHVFVILAIRSTAGAFHWPAMMASTSLMVPEEHFARIQGINQTFNGLLNVISGPLGAIALQILPVYGVLFIDVGTALVAVVPLLMIPVPQPLQKILRGKVVEKTSAWQDFKEGFRFVFTWPGLLIIIVIASVVNLVLVPGFSLLPILVNKYFGGGALQLGWMQSAFGFGVIFGGVLLSIWGGFRRRVVTSLIGLIGFGLGVLVLGLLPSDLFGIAIAVAFWIGFASPISNGPLMAAVQAVVDPSIQGRVFTLISSSVGAMSPLGLLIAGPFADHYGVQLWYLIGGALTLFMAFIAFLIPSVVNIDAKKKAAIPVAPVSSTPSD